MQSNIYPLNGFRAVKLSAFGDLLIEEDNGKLHLPSAPCVMSEYGLLRLVKDDSAIVCIDNANGMIHVFKGSLLIKKQVKLMSKSTGQWKYVERLLYIKNNKPANVKNTEYHLFDNIYWCPFELKNETFEYYTLDYLKGL